MEEAERQDPPVPFRNHSTGEEFEDEDEYLRSLKRDDYYDFSYRYEYVAERFGDGDDDVRLEIATVNVSLSWDDSPAPGYVVSYTVDSPTPIPNEWTGDADQLFDDLRSQVSADLGARGVGPELYKDWPV